MIDPLFHHGTGEIARIARPISYRHHRNHPKQQIGRAKHRRIAHNHDFQPTGEDVRLWRNVQREAFRRFFVAESVAFANRGLRQHPTPQSRLTSRRSLVSSRQFLIRRLQSGDAVAVGRFGRGDHFPNQHPRRGTGGSCIGRYPHLLDPHGLDVDIAQRDALAGLIAQTVIPRATVGIPVGVPEGHAIGLRPVGRFTGLPFHLKLVELVLTRQLPCLCLPFVFRIRGHRLNGEAGPLVHHNLQALVQRLVDEVVDNPRRLSRTQRFTPRT